MPSIQRAVAVAALSFVFVAAGCQPAEGPAERAGKQVDQAADKVGDQVEKAGDKIENAADKAKN
jgi:hypothetical protein